MHVNGLSAYSIFCGRQSSDMLRAFVGEREAAMQVAMHCAQLWMACLRPIEECIARSALGKRQEARERTVSAASGAARRQTSTMLRAFVGEREAAAEDAMHCAQLWMGCLKPVEECTARKTSHGRRKGFVSTLAVSSV